MTPTLAKATNAVLRIQLVHYINAKKITHTFGHIFRAMHFHHIKFY